jgi:hypothetical protein
MTYQQLRLEVYKLNQSVSEFREMLKQYMDELLTMGRLVRSDRLALTNFGCVVNCINDRILELEADMNIVNSKTQNTVLIPMPDLSYGMMTKVTAVKIKDQTMMIDVFGNRYIEPLGQSGYEMAVNFLYGDNGTYSVLQLNLLKHIEAQVGFFTDVIGPTALLKLGQGGVIQPLRANMSSFGKAVLPIETFAITLDDLALPYENLMRVHYQGQAESVIGIAAELVDGLADEVSKFVTSNVPIPFIDTIYSKVSRLVSSFYYPKNKPPWADLKASIDDGGIYTTYTWPSRDDFPQRPKDNYASREDLLELVYREDGMVAGALTGLSSPWRVYTYVQPLSQSDIMSYFGKTVFNASISLTVLSTVNAVALNDVVVAYRDPGSGSLIPVPNATLKPTSTTPIDLTI